MKTITFADFMAEYDTTGVHKLTRHWTDHTPYAQGYTSFEDRKLMLTLIRHYKLKNCLELGVNNGLTAKMILDHCPSVEKYTGIDVPHDYKTPLAAQTHEPPASPGEHAKNDPRFTAYVLPRGTSELHEMDIGTYDWVFIDADHSYSGVHRDTEIAIKLTHPGSVIVWHDYKPTMLGLPCETKRAIDELPYDLTHLVSTCTCYWVRP